MTIMTSREFAEDGKKAKQAAAQGPVFITENGQSSYVFLTIDDFNRMRPQLQRSLWDSLSMDETDEIDFEPDPVREFDLKIPDFS